MKSDIIDRLGQTDLLLPSAIGQGLAANNRVKVRLSILQAAAAHAFAPNRTSFDLTDECRAVGIDPVPMELLVNHASPLGGERITAPGLGNLETAIWADVTAMAEAVAKGDTAAADAARARLIAIKAADDRQALDEVELARIAKLTGLSATGDDSLHRVVMDLHKMLNRLSAAHAEEIVAGAHVHGLAVQDRPAVEAFMR